MEMSHIPVPLYAIVEVVRRLRRIFGKESNRGIRGIRGRRTGKKSVFRVFRVFRGFGCGFPALCSLQQTRLLAACEQFLEGKEPRNTRNTRKANREGVCFPRISRIPRLVLPALGCGSAALNSAVLLIYRGRIGPSRPQSAQAAPWDNAQS